MKISYSIPVMAALTLVGCNDSDSTGPSGDEYDFSDILNTFQSKVAIATYADLDSKASTLATRVAAFASSGSQADLNAACDAWRASRVPWESSEAFLFGPAAILSLDPSLDSWPVDVQQLDDVLASDFELTVDFVAEGLGPALRGFHTIEYLLFEGGAPGNAADVTDRERAYLVAVTGVLANDTATLHEAWADGGDFGPAFGPEFAAAGTSGSRYFTQADAALEMVEGMIGICDEVGNGKIGDPYAENDPGLVESQFSWNSLVDFQNNMASVKNAYMGGYTSDGPGLNDFVAEKDADLDARLQNEIDAATAAIASIPEPFRGNLSASSQIEAAQQAIATVLETLDGDVRALLGGST